MSDTDSGHLRQIDDWQGRFALAPHPASKLKADGLNLIDRARARRVVEDAISKDLEYGIEVNTETKTLTVTMPLPTTPTPRLADAGP